MEALPRISREGAKRARLDSIETLWQGGGSGFIESIDESTVSKFRRSWCSIDDSDGAIAFLHNRWRVALKVFHT